MAEKLYQVKKNKDALAEILSKDPKMTWSAIQKSLEEKLGIKWSRPTITDAKNKILIELKIDMSIDKKSESLSLSLPPSNMDGSDKASWFISQFKKTHLYTTLLNQFSEDEISTYLAEYGTVCCQFEDIVGTEFYQIDDFLKHRILINRQISLMRKCEIDLEEANKWVSSHPIDASSSKEDKEERGNQFRMINGFQSTLSKASERYDKLTAERNKIYANLSATRKDRIEELRGGGDTFLDLVASLHSSISERNRHGRYAQLTKLAADRKGEEFRQETAFPDGSKDVIILDEQTPDEILEGDN